MLNLLYLRIYYINLIKGFLSKLMIKFIIIYYNSYLYNSSYLYYSLYSSMVERNTVNILINVRFILRAWHNTVLFNVNHLSLIPLGSLYILIIYFQTFLTLTRIYYISLLDNLLTIVIIIRFV